MKILIWVLTLLVLAPWTGAAWLAHALVDVSGNWMSGNADLLAGDPELVATLSWLGRVLAGVGETVIVIVWGLGTAIIVGIALLFSRLVDRDRRIKSMQWHPDDPRATSVERVP